MSRIEELRAAYAATAQRHWEVLPTCGIPHVVRLTENGADVETLAACCSTRCAEFIALAHNLMPQLLEAMELVQSASYGNTEYEDLTRRANGILAKM